MRLVSLLVAVLFALAACGGGGDGDTTAFCDEYESFIETTQTADQSTPEGLEKAVGQTLDSLSKLAAALPTDQAELEEDVEALVEVYRGIASLLEEADWDQTKVDPKEYEELVSRQSELGETQQKLVAYAEGNCDLGTGTPGTDPTAPETSQPPVGPEGTDEAPIVPSG